MLTLSGIYLIKNTINGKVYVGKSKNIYMRWYSHKSYLRRNKNSPNAYLQRSWNRHGEKCFEFTIIECCAVTDLKIKEEYYINLYKSYDPKNGYNIMKISEGVIEHSEESKDKIREARKKQVGSNHPMYGRKGEDNPLYKIPRTEETKRKISNSHFGIVPTDEARKKMSEAKIGMYCGDKSPRAILEWEDIREIRRKYIPYKYSSDKLAKEYGVGKTTILRIIHNETWKED